MLRQEPQLVLLVVEAQQRPVQELVLEVGLVQLPAVQLVVVQQVQVEKKELVELPEWAWAAPLEQHSNQHFDQTSTGAM